MKTLLILLSLLAAFVPSNAGAACSPSIQPDGYNIVGQDLLPGTRLRLQPDDWTVPFPAADNIIEIFNAAGVIAQFIPNLSPDSYGMLELIFNPLVPSDGPYVFVVTDPKGNETLLAVRIQQAIPDVPAPGSEENVHPPRPIMNSPRRAFAPHRPHQSALGNRAVPVEAR